MKKSFYLLFGKRFLDLLFSIIFFIILLPFCFIIILLILLIDHINPFYSQIRTGINGSEFLMYKFRTMRNDKSITLFGRFLRFTSLDEIPQLINVIKGDMSLIGPRPWIPDYYEKFNKRQKRRVSVRPGIIGLAQVNGRNQITIFQKIDYDLEYIDNLSLLLDIKILFKSFKVLFTHDDITKVEEHIREELEELENKKLSKKK